MDTALSIGELTKQTGVPAETLRRWERDYGLLQPSRTDGGQRRYGSADVRRIEVVLELARQGWSRSDAARTVAEHGHAPQPPLDTSLFDALPLGVVVTDAAQRIVYINPHATRVLETDLETLKGKSGFEHLDADGQREALESYERLRRGEQLTADMRLRSASGREVILGQWTCPLFAPDGTYRGAVGITVDRTADHSNETDLQLHARLLEAVGEAVVATDLEGRVLYWSPAAERQFGCRSNEVIGHDVIDVVPAGVVDQMRGMSSEAISGGHCVREVRSRRRDGAEIESRVTISPMLDDGVVTGFIGVFMDITDRKRTEREAQCRAAQQEVVSVVGQLALAGDSVASMVEHAARAVLGTLDADFVSVLETPVGGENIRVRYCLPASTSPPGTTGPFTSHSAYTLRSQRPVVVDDYLEERRFGRGPLDAERLARSGVCVPITPTPGSVGVLCVHWNSVRPVSTNDVSFLQSVANLIAFALQRDAIESELRRFTEP